MTKRILPTVNRFDFEQQIMSCWNVTNDVLEVCKAHLDRGASKDEVANALIGISALYEMRFQVLFDQFESLVRQNNC